MTPEVLERALQELIAQQHIDIDVARGRLGVRRRVRRRRARMLSAVGSVGVVLMAVGWVLIRGDGARQVITAAPRPQEEPRQAVEALPAPVLRGGTDATPLGSAPVPVSADATLVWTGEEVVIYNDGGVLGDPVTSASTSSSTSSTAFNVRTGQWRELLGSPLAADPSASVSGVWTGSEVLVWNGTGAASWDPLTGQWRQHDGFPAGAPYAVWTGTRLKAWEQGISYRPRDHDVVGLTPFPGTDRITAAVWAGASTLVLTQPEQTGVFQGPGSGPPPQLWQLDLAGQRWRRRADPPSAGSASWAAATWDGTRVITAHMDGAVVAFDPELDQWTAWPTLPGPSCAENPALGLVAGRIYANWCGRLSVLGPLGGWEPKAVPAGPMVAAGTDLFVLADGGNLYRLDLSAYAAAPPR